MVVKHFGLPQDSERQSLQAQIWRMITWYSQYFGVYIHNVVTLEKQENPSELCSASFFLMSPTQGKINDEASHGIKQIVLLMLNKQHALYLQMLLEK